MKKQVATAQLYNDGPYLRAFNEAGMCLFTIEQGDYSVLDFLGFPCLGKGSGWKRREWGYEIEGRFSFRKVK